MCTAQRIPDKARGSGRQVARALTLLPAANCIVLAARHLLRDLWAVHTDIKRLFQFVRLLSFSFPVRLQQGTEVHMHIFVVFFSFF